MNAFIDIFRESLYKHSASLSTNDEQSGTKPKLVAEIVATNFGFVPDWWVDKCFGC